MKISVISVHKVKNYGSALLCYATQEILKQAGFEEIEFLNIKRGRMEEADNFKEFWKALTDDLTDSWKNISIILCYIKMRTNCI